MDRKRVKRNRYEEIEKLQADQLTETNIIRPHVFGTSSKFAEVDDNGSLIKVDGSHKRVAGETISIKSSGYWYLIQAIIRQLPRNKMNDRDEFILEKFCEYGCVRKVNNALKNPECIFEGYSRPHYVTKKIERLIREYFLSAKSELLPDYKESEFKLENVKSKINQVIFDKTGKSINLAQYDKLIRYLLFNKRKPNQTIIDDVVAMILN